MVVFVAVFAQGFKTSFVSAVDRSVNAAIVVSGQSGGTVPGAALATVRAVPTKPMCPRVFVTAASAAGIVTPSTRRVALPYRCCK